MNEVTHNSLMSTCTYMESERSKIIRRRRHLPCAHLLFLRVLRLRVVEGLSRGLGLFLGAIDEPGRADVAKGVLGRVRHEEAQERPATLPQQGLEGRAGHLGGERADEEGGFCVAF